MARTADPAEQAKLQQLNENLSQAIHLNKDAMENILLDETNQQRMQRSMPFLLRKAAIDHLRTGEGVVANGFQGEYSAVSLGESNNDFLDKQSREGAWATYIEAQALGEKLGCNVVVTYTTPGKEDATWCLHRADGDAPTIHLYNSSNTHWYVDKNTIGDGNCLYNAFAQALQAQLNVNKPKNTQDSSLTNHGMFRPIAVVDDVIKLQEVIINAIKTHPTPGELHNKLEKQRQDEEARLSKLEPKERDKIEKQIKSDYELALQFAHEEKESPSYKLKI